RTPSHAPPPRASSRAQHPLHERRPDARDAWRRASRAETRGEKAQQRGLLHVAGSDEAVRGVLQLLAIDPRAPYSAAVSPLRCQARTRSAHSAALTLRFVVMRPASTHGQRSSGCSWAGGYAPTTMAIRIVCRLRSASRTAPGMVTGRPPRTRRALSG